MLQLDIQNNIWWKKYHATVKEAVKAGNLIGLKYLIEERKIPINSKNRYEILRTSARRGHIKILKYLIEHVINHDMDIYADYFALTESATYGRLEAIKYMVEEYGIDMDSMKHALELSAIHGHLQVARYLVGRGINIHFYNDITLLSCAVNGSLESIKFIVEECGDVNKDRMELALRISAEHGHLKVVEYFVDHVDNINADRSAALRHSTVNGRLDVVRCLVENGARFNRYDTGAVRLAEHYGYKDVVSYLKDKFSIN
jgi:ankyrin repeat protein